MIRAIAWRVAPSGHFVVYALTAHGRILVRVDQPLPNGGWVTLSDWLEAAAAWHRSPEEWVEAHRRRGSRGGAVIAQHPLLDVARAVLDVRRVAPHRRPPVVTLGLVALVGVGAYKTDLLGRGE